MTDVIVVDDGKGVGTEGLNALVALSPSQGVVAVRPSWMKPDEENGVQESLGKFVELVRANPTDIRLSTQVYKLGEEGARELMPFTQLYERKINEIMSFGSEGSPANKNILQVKQTTDTINPVILAKQPIAVKVAVFFTKNRLPGGQEILDIIYARRETVKSTIDGLKQSLWTTRDQLIDNVNDLVAIYDGLLKGQRMIERDIFFGQLLHAEVKKILDLTVDEIARQNLEQLLADITTQVINLQTEENANMQFFAGSQAMAKLTNQQIQNIGGMTRLLERSVLANLGLRVVAAELGRSIAVTEQLKKTIGDTIADTGKQIEKQGDMLNKARAQAMIDLNGLEEGCKALEAFFTKQAEANRAIIETGSATSKRLQEMTGRLRQRVEGGHETMKELTSGKEITAHE